MRGTITGWSLPSVSVLTIFMWLPRCVCTSNPNRLSMVITWLLDNLLSRGNFREFHLIYQGNAWVGYESESCRIFPFE